MRGHLLLLATVLTTLSSSEATEYYVKPTEPQDTPCPADPCYTLEEYAENATRYFTDVSNVSVRLLPGVHEIKTTLVFAYVNNLEFLAYNDTTTYNGTVNINNGGIILYNSSNVTLERFTCNQSSMRLAHSSNVNMATVTFINAGTILFVEPLDVQLFQVVIDGGGMRLLYAAGNFSIVQTHVKNTVVSGLSFYTDSLANPNPLHLMIKDSIFENYTGDSGVFDGFINIRLEPNFQYIDINIENTIVKGGKIFLYFAAKENHANITIRDSFIVGSDSTAIAMFSYQDGGSSMPGRVNILNCEIIGHSQGGILFYFRDSYPEVVIQDSVIRDNELDLIKNPLKNSGDQSSPFAAGLSVLIYDSSAPTSVTVSNVTFENNSATGILGPFSAVVALYNARVCVHFTNCNFIGNKGTPILASSSVFCVSGELSFVNNSAYQGGAISFVGYPPDKTSFMSLQNNTQILFQDNHAAQGGGAVYVADTTRLSGVFDDDSLHQPCFFTSFENASLTFVNNTADNGGDAIYGPFETLAGSKCKMDNLHFGENGRSNLSLITSDPSRVCFCERGRPVCTTIFSREVRYPGETFSLLAAVVGETFGTVAGSVYTQFLPLLHGVAPELGQLQQSQATVSDNCTALTYTIQSDSKEVVVVLTANEVAVTAGYPNITQMISNYERDGTISRDLLTIPLYINVTLHPCPLGFMLSGHPGKCVCDAKLQQNNITCDINDQTVHRSGTVWVNASYTGNTSNGVVVQKFCPFHYCKKEEVGVNLEYPDTQCAFHHSGVLCGGCQPDLSLSLGGDQCLSCSNKFIALLIPFAVAGFALVVFIKVLNLTVSVGAINGLIFYAHIVGGTHTLWFPAGETNILTVFIAWLNLDLGIETCFVDGLDGYWKTWLQFVFPLYVWTIVGAIIVASHYSTRIARIFGNNTVPVLATLFLISYAKLLRTIITILSFAVLDYPDGSKDVVWAFDGNIRYLSLAHIPLFLAAVGVLVFLFLPYTIILLFGQCLQRIDNKAFKWVAKMKPVFDAYYAPFEDEHRYWIGVLLLARCALLLTFSLTVVNDPDANLLVLATTALVLLLYSATNIAKSERQEPRNGQQGIARWASQFVGSCYKKWYLSLLENSFIFNLGVLAAGTLYIGLDGGNQAALVYTSTSIALGQFTVMVLIHTIKYVFLKAPVQVPEANYDDLREDGYENLDQNHRLEDSGAFRESILEYIDTN